MHWRRMVTEYGFSEVMVRCREQVEENAWKKVKGVTTEEGR